MSDDHAQIVSLLSERWVLALSTVDTAGTYTTPLFYAVDAEHSAAGDQGPRLIFVSDPATAHGRMLGTGPTRASATTYLESRDIAELRGVQMRGFVTHQQILGSDETSRLRSLYLQVHPVARAPLESASPPAVYALDISWAKLTDNRLGFGTHRTVIYTGWNDAPEKNTNLPPLR